MTRVHLTGMSGTGKSTVIARLAELGYAAVDLDEPAWSIYDETGDWIWREDGVRRLLDENEPLLRGVASREIDTRAPLEDVVSEVLDAAGCVPPGSAPARDVSCA